MKLPNIVVTLQDGSLWYPEEGPLPRMLGDVEGHPFHGNQWTTGVSGGASEKIKEYAQQAPVQHVFHGTTYSAWNSIQKEGLIPKKQPGADALSGAPDYVQFDGDRKASIYVTGDLNTAETFAEFVAKGKNLVPVVLEVEVPPQFWKTNVKEDEQAPPDMKAYRIIGKVPPEWIHMSKRRGKATDLFGGGNRLLAAMKKKLYVVLFVDPNAPKSRAAARHPEGPLHAAADKYISKLTVALRYAFAKGRKALGPQRPGKVPNVDKAVAAVADALRAVLPATLIKIAAEGGDVALGALAPRMKVAEDRVVPSKGPLKMRFDRTNQRVVDWADRHAAELITNITETTRDDLNNAIADAIEGGDLDELYDEILDAVGNEARAELIARTEVMRAANEGQREGWRQATDEGLLSGDERTAWIATGDATVCPLCDELDGAERDMDGEYPDPGGDGPPLHPNCRCTEGIVGGFRSAGDVEGHPFHGNQWTTGVGGPGFHTRMVSRRAEQVADRMGVPPSIIDVVDKEPTPFTVGDRQFREAGHFDPTTRRIEINARNSYDARMSVTNGIAAHEVSHAVYHAAREAQEAEHAQMSTLSAEEYNRLFTKAGYARPETQQEIHDRWPVSAVFYKHLGDALVETEAEQHASPSGDSRYFQKATQLAKDDGVTDYSKAYWPQELLKQPGGFTRAINETLAEVARYKIIKESGAWEGAPPHPSWQAFSEDLLATVSRKDVQGRIRKGIK
jgi:SPP1 gp7 family putative phage head morphogenesis protein